MLRLQAVDKGWRNLIASHEDALFSEFVRNDFVEGDILIDVLEKRSGQPGHGHDNDELYVSYKKLYLAFQNRFKLHEQDGNEVCVPYYSHNSGDIDHLAFIARFGDDCSEMEWNSRDPSWFSPSRNDSDCLELKLPMKDFRLSLQREQLFEAASDDADEYHPLV